MPGVPSFSDCGLALNERWSTVDTDRVTPEARDVLRVHRATIFQLHPDDDEPYAKFVAEYDAAKAKKAAPKK